MKVHGYIRGQVLGVDKKQYQDKVSYSLKLLQGMNIASISVPVDILTLFQKNEQVELEVEINDFKDRSGFYLRYISVV